MNDEERKELNQLYEKYGMLQNSAIAKNIKIKEALEVIEKMINLEEDDCEQGVPCSMEKLVVLESIKEILEK